MGKKVIFCMLNFLCFSFMTKNMDDPTPSSRSRARKLSSVVVPIGSPVGDMSGHTVIAIPDIPSAAVAAPAKPKNKIPAIKLFQSGSKSDPSPASADRMLKKRVESIKELRNQIKDTQNTQRTARGDQPVRRRKFNIDDENIRPTASAQADDASDEPVRKKRSLLPVKLALLRDAPLPEKTYTEEEVWSFIKMTNPIFSEFAEQYKLDLEDVELFARCIEELEINPTLITEHLYGNVQQQAYGRFQRVMAYCFGDPHQQHLDRLHKQYEKMQQERPEEYKAMLLELMKAAADQADGLKSHRSKIADVHTDFQNAEIASKIQENRLTMAGLFVSIATAVGGWAFGIVTPLVNPCNGTV